MGEQARLREVEGIGPTTEPHPPGAQVFGRAKRMAQWEQRDR